MKFYLEGNTVPHDASGPFFGGKNLNCYGDLKPDTGIVSQKDSLSPYFLFQKRRFAVDLVISTLQGNGIPAFEATFRVR
ncbi:hypothetical protein [Hymenobacter jeongseonensis]|uniref:hypothetical protein n=1 Tax=Hymenobacter jeongseonensis TaxID=2791027 RepID=UPI0018AF8B68|nr:hypothetical protein [Hymenobacter jeongseonensis]